MSTQPGLAALPLSTPLEAEVRPSRGVYAWWLDTARSPTPEAAGLHLPAVPRLRHSSGRSELLYVGRARRDLHRRITGQHLRRSAEERVRRRCWPLIRRWRSRRARPT